MQAIAERIEDVVKAIWAELLPHSEFDPSLTWNEAGVDSLKSLHFLLRLEQQLGRPISFDLLTPQMTIGELLSALTGPCAEPVADREGAHPTVFLLPGIFGDEPILAEFRRSLQGRVQFELLSLPDIDAPLELSTSFDAMARHTADQILQKAGAGPIHLAGYSYGGFLAFETARVLKRRGAELGLLVLLDTMIGAPRPQPTEAGAGTPKALKSNLWTKIARFPDLFSSGVGRFADRLAFRLAIETGRLALARRLTLNGADRYDFDRNFRRRRELLTHFRARAVRQWRPEPLEAKVLLITSDEYDETSNPRVWRDLCPDLLIQPVGGRHREIFNPDALSRLNPVLLTALEAFQAGAA